MEALTRFLSGFLLMSVNRKDLIKHLEAYGCRFLREGARHSIYTNGKRIIPIDMRPKKVTLSAPSAAVQGCTLSATASKEGSVFISRT